MASKINFREVAEGLRVLPDGTRIERVPNEGRKAWAIRTRHWRGENQPGHRYTLTSGYPCWDWAPTLAEALDLVRALSGDYQLHT